MKSLSALWALLLLPIAAIFFQTTAQAETKATKSAAVQYKINFNTKQSIGRLTAHNLNGDEKYQGSNILGGTDLGQARGLVTLMVPRDKRLGLNLNSWGFAHPEVLNKITPNIIEGLLLQIATVTEDNAEAQRIGTIISHLDTFNHLKELFLDKSDINDAQLNALPDLPLLERLSVLFDVSFAGSSLKHLSRCSNLCSLCLRCTSLDGKNLADLEGFKKLEYLDLGQTNLQGQLKYMPACPSIRRLDLSTSRTSDDDLRYLRQLKNLEVLDLSNCRISDKGLSYIAVLKKLKTLELATTSVTISGTINFARKMHLSHLSITDRGFTPKEKQILQNQCPSVYFVPPPSRVAPPSRYIRRLFAPVTRGGGL